MIFGRDFVWFHLGKAAGNTLRMYFEANNYLVNPQWNWSRQMTDPRSPTYFHANLEEAEEAFPKEDFSSKDKIINFRKIEDWLPSFNNHICYSSGRKDMTAASIREHTVLGLAAGDKEGQWTSADKRLEKYTKNVYIKHYLRVEHLYDDFYKVFKNYGLREQYSPSLAQLVCNASGGQKMTFTEEEKHQIYDRNPLWMSVQRAIY